MSVSAVFDESFYLTNNEDVVLALAQRHFTSALQHFEAFGVAELRNPNAQFNSSYYAAQNPDVLSVAAQGVFPSVFAHFRLLVRLRTALHLLHMQALMQLVILRQT